MPIDHASITMLVIELGRVPNELRRELRPAIRDGAEHIIRDMQGRADWSTRIPSAIKMSVLFSSLGSGGGAKIRVDRNLAPHARPFEGASSRGGFFRHPVFGDRTTWVSQSTRPFFFPAIKAGRAQLQKNIADAVRASLRKVSR